MQNNFLLAYKIRKSEQLLLDLFGQGLLGGTIHTCVGQEFSGIAVAKNIKPGDVVVSNHRCHGHYLAIFEDYEGLIAEIMGKPHGVNRGFGGSQHIHREGFYSSGIQGGMLPSACGVALSHKIAGRKNIAVSFIGDGTLGQGVVYETLNFAAKHSTPLVLVVENNKYSQSTSQSETLSGTIKDRAAAFGIEYFHGHTNLPEELMTAVSTATKMARDEVRPVIIEIETYRLNPHSKGDDLRDQAEKDQAWKDDSLAVYMESANSEFKAECEKFDKYISEVVEKAMATEDSIRVAVTKENATSKEVSISQQNQTSQIKEINRALLDIFKTNNECLFLGEDVRSPYGGAFKASKDLSAQNPDRVLNMPISEPSIVGISLGASTTGRVVFSEIMFGDFLALAFDQILNHASKMKAMFGKEVLAPLVIRTPMGGGRGYGATHSQCIEKHFLGVSGLDVYMFHPRVDSYKFYTELAGAVKNPALVFEHKLLYAKDPFMAAPEDYEVVTNQNHYTRLKTSGATDITIVAFGGTGFLVESIVDEVTDEEINLDIIYPFDLNSEVTRQEIANSVRESKKILFVEEGNPGFTVSDGFLANLAKDISGECKFFSRSITAEDMPIAASTYLEKQILPSHTQVLDEIWELFDE